MPRGSRSSPGNRSSRMRPFGRRLVGVAGTHGKSTTAGWLVHVLVAAGLDPSAFVGALLPADDAGGAPSTARFGAGTRFRRGGGRVRGQLRCLPSRRRGPDQRRVGSPGRVSGRGGCRCDVRTVGPAGTRGRHARRERRRSRSREHRGGARGLVRFDRGVRAHGRDGRGRGARRACRRRRGSIHDGRRTGNRHPRTRHRHRSLRHDARDPRSRRGGGTITTHLATAGRHNAPNALAVAGAAALLGVLRTRHRHAASHRSAASAGASSERAKLPASSSTTITATTRPPSAPPSRRSASASPAGPSGPSTSR